MEQFDLNSEFQESQDYVERLFPQNIQTNKQQNKPPKKGILE